MGPRAQRVTEMNGCSANLLFTAKSLMRSVPEYVILINLIMSVGFFGYAIRVFDQ